ncbi:MAG: PQQ-like beta-propeller repeat protein [Planctomycetota bacterium]|nr:PQQ-like beta-propeller repeat protein [Planctomycetota bacterium]
MVANSPRLLDTWPKNGPPLVWKSDWVPGCEEGGFSQPVVADGKVFVYANAKNPVGGGDGFKFITRDLLLEAGWLPELPDELAQRIEAAWASKNRPGSAGWQWYNREMTGKEGALEAFLAKTPALDKYIKDFIATLSPEDARKYGDYVKRRLCIDTPRNKWGVPNSQTWDTLVKLSKLQDTVYRSRREWGAALRRVSPNAECLAEDYPDYHYWYRVFTMADTVFCLDAATGKTIWRKDFPEEWSLAKNNKGNVQWWCFDSLGASGTPSVVGDRCYAAGAMGLYCFSTSDGALLWQVKGEPAHTQVLVVDGVVYDGGRGCAYDAASGALVWKHPLWPQGRWPVKDDQYRWNPPLLWSHGGQNHIVTTDGGVSSYCCLEAKTGKVLWNQKTPIGMFATVRGDTLVVPAPYGGGGTKAFKLSPTGAELLWSKGFASVNGQVLYEDHLYLLDRCVDAKTGEVNWKSPLSIDTFAPPLLVDGKIIVPLGSAHQVTKQWGGGYALVMFKATPERYVELGRFDPHACHMTPPAFADGKLFVRLLDCIACYDLREHGIYLDGVAAGKDALRFQFKQTGGGLVEKDLKDLLITDAAGARPAKAKIVGDEIVVDIADAAAPFSLSYAGTVLKGKNGQPVPAFGWNLARELKVRECFGNTIVLSGNAPLLQEGGWDKTTTYAGAGAQITAVTIAPTLKNVNLTTDKTWKPGDALNLTYACFPVTSGEPRRAAVAFTVAEPQRPAAQLVTIDETTLGNWKGVYGADGAVICGDKAAQAPGYAMVTLPKQDGTPWAPNAKDERYLQKSGQAKDRTVTSWASEDQFEIEVAFTDGKEHQVAFYCLDWGNKTQLRVEVMALDTQEILDTQTIKAHNRGKYLVWNIKGQVRLCFGSVIQDEGSGAVVGGVFFDPPAAVQSVPRETAATAQTGMEDQPNWAGFRGLDRFGVAAGGSFPTTFDVATGRNILWKTSVPTGTSSPVVWGDKVFVTSSDGKTDALHCFDTGAGKDLWKQTIPVTGKTPEPSKDAGFAAPTPVTDGQRVYVVFASGNLAAFDFTGKLIWSRALGPFGTTYGYASSPVVAGRLLVLQLDIGGQEKSHLLALDGLTGKDVWKKTRESHSSWTTPAVVEAAGRDMIVTTALPRAIAYDARDGTEIWRAEGLGRDMAVSPICAAGKAFLVQGDGRLAAVALDDAGDVKPTWTVTEGSMPSVCSPVSDGKQIILFADSQTLRSFSVKDGRKLWERDLELSCYSSLSLAGESIYLISREENSAMTVVSSSNPGRPPVKSQLGEPCSSSPALQNSRMFIRGNKTLFCIGGPRK